MCAYKKKMQKTKINSCLQISQLLLLFFITLGVPASIVDGLEGTRTSYHWGIHPTYQGSNQSIIDNFFFFHKT